MRLLCCRFSAEKVPKCSKRTGMWWPGLRPEPSTSNFQGSRARSHLQGGLWVACATWFCSARAGVVQRAPWLSATQNIAGTTEPRLVDSCFSSWLAAETSRIHSGCVKNLYTVPTHNCKASRGVNDQRWKNPKPGRAPCKLLYAPTS